MAEKDIFGELQPLESILNYSTKGEYDRKKDGFTLSIPDTPLMEKEFYEEKPSSPNYLGELKNYLTDKTMEPLLENERIRKYDDLNRKLIPPTLLYENKEFDEIREKYQFLNSPDLKKERFKKDIFLDLDDLQEQTGPISLDDLDQVIQGFVSAAFLNSELRSAFSFVTPQVGVYEGIGKEQLLKQLELAAVESRAAFLKQLEEAFTFVQFLSTHKVAGITFGQEGELNYQIDKISGPILPGDTEAYTAFSMTPEEVQANEARFFREYTFPGLEGVTTDLYKIATVLADPRGRAEINKALGKLEEERSSSLEALVDGNSFKVDVLTLGASTHASNFVTTLRTLRPDLVLGGVDKYPEAAYLWNNRGWIRQNNTNGPASTRGGNLPREEGDLFPTGYFGAVRVPMVSHGRWPGGDDAGIALRWNLNEYLDHLLLNHTVTEVTPSQNPNAKYAVHLQASNGDKRTLFTDTIITTGQIRGLNPFFEGGKVTDQASFDIWQEEIEKAQRGEEALVYDYDTFSVRISSLEGMSQFMDDLGSRSKRIGVGGARDGGRTVVAYLLEQSQGANSYRGRITQVGGKRPTIFWFGQEAQNAEQYSKQARGVYSPICSGYTSGKIVPVEPKITKLRRTDNGLKVFYGQRNCEVDTLVFTGGFEPIPDKEVFGSLANFGRETIYDRESRGVLSRLKGTQIYFAGPSSGIGIEDVGGDVKKVFEDLGIDENLVANWWRGPQVQRGAIQLAKTLPPSYLRNSK